MQSAHRGWLPCHGVPVFSSIFAEDTIANSNLQLTAGVAREALQSGLQFNMAYTFSKSIDEASSFEGSPQPIAGREHVALSLFDARHRFVISYDWALPIPKY